MCVRVRGAREEGSKKAKGERRGNGDGQRGWIRGKGREKKSGRKG